MKKTSLLLSMLILTSMTVFAQNMGKESQLETNFLSSKTTAIFKGYKDTNGSIYMDENFQNGSVIMNGKVVANKVALRYNVKDEEIELKSGSNKYTTVANIIKKDNGVHVTINNQTLVFLPSSEEDIKDGYFIVIEEGDKMSLYHKLTKVFIAKKVSVNSISRTVPNTFKEKVFLYVKTADEKVQIVSNSKSKRLKLFVDKENEIKVYVKKKGLNLRKDTDFALAIKYYNNLF